MAENSNITLALYEFAPWRVGPNDTRVVTSEVAWRNAVRWEQVANLSGEICKAVGGDPSKPGTFLHKGITITYVGSPRVLCTVDVFEDWQGGQDYPGEMHNAKGGRLSVNARGQIWSYDTDGTIDDDWGVEAFTMNHVRQRLFRLIDATPNLDWLLITKRPENVLKLCYDQWCKPVKGHVRQNDGDGRRWEFPNNVWIGTSVENQQTANERIPHLLNIPASVRFLSCEPLLGPVRMPFRYGDDPYHGDYGQSFITQKINWVICGGESGPTNARPMHPYWARGLRDQCTAANVPFFFTGWGEWIPSGQSGCVGGPEIEMNDIDFDGTNLTKTNRHGSDKWAAMYRVGKAAAGRILDGLTWDELPKVTP